MKISRSYLLGLGSGLILSALLAMVIPPISINFNGSLEQAQENPAPKPPENPTTLETEKDPIVNPEESSKENPKDNPQDNLENDSEGGDAPVQIFIIPSGSTADRIANLLLAEGWISSKEEFLDLVKEGSFASRFRAGSFELTPGMTGEEILGQLIPDHN